MLDVLNYDIAGPVATDLIPYMVYKLTPLSDDKACLDATGKALKIIQAILLDIGNLSSWLS